MASSKLHTIIPFKKLFLLLLSIAFSMQIIIISYNHFSGFYTIETAGEAAIRLIFGTFLSLVAAFLLAYPDLYLIRFLNRNYPWKKKAIQRSIIQLMAAISIGVIIAVAVTTLAHLINNYEEDLLRTYVFNSIVVAICNVSIMIIFEAWIFFIAEAESEKRNEELMKELTQIRFEVLKNQMNPHFMFNSLNVLTGLIETDPEKSQRFIEEFSSIYRYVLDTIEQPVVTLEKELEFARSYMYLQQIRHGDFLNYNVNIRSELLSCYLPPLSLQVVLENAIKHNQVSKEKPLHIEIFDKEDDLIVTNTLQPKMTFGKSTGIGQKNLEKRYAMVCARIPQFNIGTDVYRVELPLMTE
ncbi:sensor histidine kinase [Rhodohalobacter sp. 614A]|uniref:sensor histidine kinase n=1 Tax=Rhodohalobacter sp. 614A TaxID=2908649 RepID=UPI001F4849B9|nr:histidine kinase [Rhodohalobacter sp. 614A]